MTPPTAGRLKFTHDRWMSSLGLPIYTGYYIEDLRELELGHWHERGCAGGFELACDAHHLF